MKNIRTQQRSFTLVEVLITTLIATVLIAGIYTTFMVGNRSWLFYTESSILKLESRRTLVGLVNELREARNVFVTSEETPKRETVTFLRHNVGTVSYHWSDQGDNAGRIIRKVNGKEKIMSGNVSVFRIDQLENDMLEISFTLTKETVFGKLLSYSLKERIALRHRIPPLR